MREGHIVNGAVGQHQPVMVAPPKPEWAHRFSFQVRCSDCGKLLPAIITVDAERPGLDPANQGMICGGCTEARNEPSPEEG